ncbi:MAG: hypothetical protein H6552_06070 [Chitinophagales bacterium]|nr:hypothetical protein [Chitinophagales bacterium]
MKKELEHKDVLLEQTHIALDNNYSYSPKYMTQSCCKKSNCCEKYKRKGKHCKKCPKK